MAPTVLSEETEGASKRKRDEADKAEEHGKKKRARNEKLLSGQGRSEARRSESLPQPDESSRADLTETNVVNAKNNRKRRQKERGQRKEVAQLSEELEKSRTTSAWNLSQSMGGRMVDVDPILTIDEKHLIIPYHTSIQVFSTAESLLVRKIALPISQLDGTQETIVAIQLSPSSPNSLWVASSSGRLWQIDWTSGSGTGSAFQLKCDYLSDITVEAITIQGKVQDLVLTSVLAESAWHLWLCDIQHLRLNSTRELISRERGIYNLRSLKNGQVVAASSGSDLLVGFLKTKSCASFGQISYDIFVLDSSDEITCLDLRGSDRVHLTERSQTETGDMPVIDVVVGCARGAVYLYSDLLPQLRTLGSKGKPKTRNYTLQPQKYHWHRKAVHAVKWSRDGNYVVSGGSESVLVLWQLDTRRTDVLPHLAATIENIVISETGSSYVIHLDDNSAMILSTAEMKPTTYISGIQSLVSPPPPSKDNFVRRVGNREIRTSVASTPAAVNPLDPTQALLCVGNGQQISHSNGAASTPLLQTIDLSTMQGVAKQAITRTNPTDVNATTKGFPITEPRVTHLAYSHDAKWLATVDEWLPPTRDVDALNGQPMERREIYLKFWSSAAPDSSAKDQPLPERSLELVSRIDAPHYSGRSEGVLDLAADPSACRFATVGEDGVVRFWQPVVRQRNGIVVKGRSGRQMESWACTQSIHLQESKASTEVNIPNVTPTSSRSGAIAFSEDGSMLACAFQSGSDAAVYIIHTESGKVVDSLDGLIHGEIQGVQVHSAHIIVLSDDLVVYNIVLDELSYGVHLRQDVKQSSAATLPGPQLAIDHTSGSIAVALTCNTDKVTVVTELAIFSLDHCEPQLVSRCPYPIVSLMTSVGSSGFLVLDSAAQLWSVSRGKDAKSVALAQPLADINLDQEEPVEMGATKWAIATADEPEDLASEDEMEVDMDEEDVGDDDSHAVVVAPQKLAELFDAAPAFAMPPIEDMFYQVAKLFSSRPYAAGAA